MFVVYCFLTTLLFLSGNGQEENKFPDDFLLGFATASYQIEGAWNEDGKGENIWDWMTHNRPDKIVNGDTGDVACDSYHKYKEDVQMLKNMGAQVYRFSLSWSRILPTGDTDIINQAGIDYYNNLIDELLANGIEPMITIYHWDLPQSLQMIGGWPNPLIADYYVELARIAFKNFGDRVKWWITFNEPFQQCGDGYGHDGQAPALHMPGIADYLCAHTLLTSHARTYHVYDDEFRPQQKGQIGITLDGGWHIPASDKQEDIDAAERNMLFEFGWYAHPVFTGDYPPVMRERIDANSANEGRPRSRLPTFDNSTKALLKGSADFLGLNHYTSYLVADSEPTGPNPSFERDKGLISWQDDAWPPSASDWLKVVPWGIRKHLNWVKNTYNVPVFVTENGFSDLGDIQDTNRINYYNAYLHEILKAIYEDGCEVLGYTAWSLMDNFEWLRGYSEKFGIYHVDFEDPNRPRTPKASVEFFKQAYTSRELPPLNSTRRTDDYDAILYDFNSKLFFKRR